MFGKRWSSTLLVLAGIAAFACDARADFQDGRWRIQVGVQTGVDSGGVERSGDMLAMATVEYEVPLTPHVCYSLKLDPIFVFTQDDLSVSEVFDHEAGVDLKDLDFHEARGGDTVLGGGVGLGLRVYQKAEGKRGLFLDLGVHTLVHDGEINGNSSNLNFMSGLGLGYQFKGGLSAQLHFDHISNAGLGDQNSGTNVLGLGVGFRF